MPHEGAEAKALAHALWQDGKYFEAGQLLFEGLAPAAQVPWSCSILSTAIAELQVRVPAAERVLAVGRDGRSWGRAHDIFSEVRREVLRLEDLPRLSREERVVLRLLFVAEQVAKVVYNATDPEDPFDEDSGWWIAECFKGYLDLLRGNDSLAVAWSILSREPDHDRGWTS